jgi:hypothetical protein
MTAHARAVLKELLQGASDEYIRRPLWEWSPADRPEVIHERRRRFGVFEETGDPEYS